MEQLAPLRTTTAKLPTSNNDQQTNWPVTATNHVESHAYQAWGRPLTRATNRDHYTRLLQQRRHVLVARKKNKRKGYAKSNLHWHKREKKERKKQQNKTNCQQQNSPSTSRTTKVRRGQQQSQKSNSSPVAFPDSAIVDRLLQHAPSFRWTPHSPAPHSSFSRSSLLAPPDVSVTFLAQDRHFCLTFVQSRRSSVLSTAPFVMRKSAPVAPSSFQEHTRLKTSVPQLIQNVQLKHKTTTTGLEPQAKHRL